MYSLCTPFGLFTRKNSDLTGCLWTAVVPSRHRYLIVVLCNGLRSTDRRSCITTLGLIAGGGRFGFLVQIGQLSCWHTKVFPAVGLSGIPDPSIGLLCMCMSKGIRWYRSGGEEAFDTRRWRLAFIKSTCHGRSMKVKL